MRKHLIQFLLVAVLSVFSAAAFAQTTVRGQLVDSETGEPLVGAAVMVEGTTQGSVTDIDGYFKQSVASNATLLFKYVGYKDQKKKIAQKGASVDLGAIQMEPDAVMLKDVVITSSVAVARKTPVAVSTITPVFIEEKLGTQEFPEVLKSTPGVYVTKDGGKTLKEIELPMDTVTEYPPHMQEYGFTLDDYQYLEMPQQDGENYTIHVMTQSGETEGLVFTSEDQGENWSFTGVFDENDLS